MSVRPRPSLEQRRDGRTNSIPFLPLAAWPAAPLGNFSAHLSLSPFLSSLLPLGRPTEDGVQVGRTHLFTQVKHLWRLTLPLVKQTVLAVPARTLRFISGMVRTHDSREMLRVFAGMGAGGKEFNQIYSSLQIFLRRLELKHRKQRILRPCCTS